MVATENLLPIWMQLLIGVAAVVVAGGIIWKKLLQPSARLVWLLDTILPLLKDLAEQFEDTPHAFKVLNEIIREFRTDSGSTLRDVVNRLEQAANESRTISQVLTSNAEAERKLGEQDRTKLAHLLELLNRVDARQHENIKTVDRLEKGATVVARELDAAQTRAELVKGAPGEAADAAVRREKQ